MLPAKEADWILAVCLTVLSLLQVYSPVPPADQQPCLTHGIDIDAVQAPQLFPRSTREKRLLGVAAKSAGSLS